jgi:hypothetical protein
MKRPSHATVVAYAALVLAMSGTAYAATGGAFILGGANSAGATSTLTTTAAGPALSLRAPSGKPALAVNTRTQVANLNANLLNGLSATGIRPVVLARQNNSAALYSTTWANVAGMSGTISIPAGRSRPTFFTYSAECVVVSGAAGDYGSIQILVDGVAVTPNSTNDADFAFCTEAPSGAPWVSATTQGYKVLTPGKHNVVVQVETVSGGSAQTRLDDMQLSVVAY